MQAWRGILNTVIACAFCVLSSSPFAVAVTWQTSQANAKQAATDQDKLLLVLHLPNPGNVDPATTRANDAFLVSSIEGNEDLLRRNFICLKQQVGVPSNIVRPATTQRGARVVEPLRRPVVYFCTPKMEVIHFATGYLGPDTLQQSAEWSIATWNSVRSEAGADSKQRKQWLRAAHLDEVPQNTIDSYAGIFPKEADFSPDETSSASKVHRFANAVARVRHAKSEGKLSQQVADAKLLDTAHRLSIDGEQTADITHLLSANLPLVPLDKVAAEYYEILADGGVFDPRSKRIKAIQGELADAKKQGSPVLLEVNAYEPRTMTPGFAAPRQIAWLTKSHIQKRIAPFHRLRVSTPELMALLHLGGQTVDRAPADSGVSFVFISRKGKLSGVVFDNGSQKHFSQQLRLALR